MTVLSDADILKFIEEGLLKIEPLDPNSISPAGYDLRSAISKILEPRSTVLINTLEAVELSTYVCGQIFIRSSFAREGLFGSFAFVDPGFRGQLTLSLSNLGDASIDIRAGERIAQIIFLSLLTPTHRPYGGRYQNSSGVVGSRRSF
ncbi:MAG: dCTP deaminase [Candidatus Methanomethylicaceae archaeon]